MARFRSRRLRPVGTVLLIYDLWRRLPPRQRRWVLAQARRHGPRIARQVAAARKRK